MGQNTVWIFAAQSVVHLLTDTIRLAPTTKGVDCHTYCLAEISLAAFLAHDYFLCAWGHEEQIIFFSPQQSLMYLRIVIPSVFFSPSQANPFFFQFSFVDRAFKTSNHSS